MQFHQTEAQGQRVMARTGKEGQGQILQALQRLREYWNVIYTLHTQPQRWVLNLNMLDHVKVATIFKATLFVLCVCSHPRLTERDGKPSATASSRVKSKQMAERVEDTRRGLPSLKQCDSGPRLGYEKEGGNTVRMLATPAMDEYPGGIQELDGQGFRWQHTASGSGGVNQQRLEGVDVSGVLPLVDSSRSTLRHRMNPRGETEGLTSTTTMSLDAQLVSDTAVW